MISGYLTIKVLLECPECESVFDLFEIDELREDGWLANLLMPSNEPWSGACKDFSKEYLESFGDDFRCPECGKVIHIGAIEY